MGSLRAASQRQTPTGSPFGAGTPHNEPSQPGAANAAFMSRYRAGSMPQRTGMLGQGSPFGTSVFSSNWMTGRERASTLQSIRSSDAPSSPRDSPADSDVRTLDYLGLIDGPQTHPNMLGNRGGTAPLTVAEMIAMNALAKNTANRFRSYSVNAKEKYADGSEYDPDDYSQMLDSGQMTPSSEVNAVQAAAIHEMVRQHNLEVQAFANFASASRPRARTAGVLDSPTARALRTFIPTPSRLDSSMNAADLHATQNADLANLAQVVQNMDLNSKRLSEAGIDSSTESPTRSLWLGNIPSSTTVSSLNVIFSPFGPIEFARVLTHKGCGFVNFENIESAISAKAQYNGKEIFPGCGPVRVGFAKEQSTSNTPGAHEAYPSPSPDPFVSKADAKTVSGAASTNLSINADTAAAALATPDLSGLTDELRQIVLQFGASQDEWNRIEVALVKAVKYKGSAQEIPPVPEASHNRLHDAPRLRETRKRIDNNSCTPVELESMAMEMLPEIAELSSDYLGNTVVQKLFEHCSEETKEAMLAKIAPHLAEIGVHKNGTWAAQKIIDVARTKRQMSMIVDALRPHAVNLFLDQYGNYVMQCCLKFQAPMNDFIFDTMIARLWDVAQGRFGARAMRACLESHFATTDQRRLMAAAITIHGVQLATNSNGALLLTWFLDTCTFPRRRSVLAPRLIPHLVHLCTHKVAYLTVLKIINQRNEIEARDTLLHALFFDEQTLQKVVSDQACGATFIFKVLTTPFLDENVRPECVENVRNVLLQLKAQPNQGYKRLMDEVGLTNRLGSTPVQQGSRSNSKARTANGHMSAQDDGQNGFARQAYANLDAQADFNTMQRPEQHAFDPYGTPISQLSQYTPSPQTNTPGMPNMSQQQLQYQQAMMAHNSQLARPPGMFPNAMQYTAPSAQMGDIYRQGVAAPGMIPGNMSAYGQQGFPQQMVSPNEYGQYGPPAQYMQQGQMAGNGGRRGRVRDAVMII